MEHVAIPQQKTPRSAEYLNRVRSHKCAVYGCYNTPVRACHEGGRKAKGIKPSDFLAIPLCDNHHNMDGYSLHRMGRESFELYYDLSINEIIAELLHEYMTGRVGDVMHFS